MVHIVILLSGSEETLKFEEVIQYINDVLFLLYHFVNSIAFNY